MSSVESTERPCVYCGATKFTLGDVLTPYRLYFRPLTTGWFYFGRREKLSSRKCNACGNVQIFGAPKK